MSFSVAVDRCVVRDRRNSIPLAILKKVSDLCYDYLSQALSHKQETQLLHSNGGGSVTAVWTQLFLCLLYTYSVRKSFLTNFLSNVSDVRIVLDH